MFTVAAIVLPLSLVTMAIEFLIDIPRKVKTRKEFAMFKRERSMFW